MRKKLNNEGDKQSILNKLLRKDELDEQKIRKVGRPNIRGMNMEKESHYNFDPANPENELEFNKAYLKLANNVALTNNTMLLSDEHIKYLNEEKKVNFKSC
jgi:hypothetical protein